MRFAHHYPEDYPDLLADYAEAADNLRKVRRERGECVCCGFVTGHHAKCPMINADEQGNA